MARVNFDMSADLRQKVRADMKALEFKSEASYFRFVLRTHNLTSKDRKWGDSDLIDFARIFTLAEGESVLFGTLEERLKRVLEKFKSTR